jgi:AbrB family looped-hinge helix DNA binding protein
MEAIMKVGPKGHVVIPHEIRHALNIYPGSKVLLALAYIFLVLPVMQLQKHSS